MIVFYYEIAPVNSVIVSPCHQDLLCPHVVGRGETASIYGGEVQVY
jgi:hypothetical protein